MANDGQSGWESTWRKHLQYGGVIITGGLPAGHAGGSGSKTTTAASEPEMAMAATAEAVTEIETGTMTETAKSYSVSVEPIGEVTFDSVPGAWIMNNGSQADMGVTLGLDTPVSVWLPDRYHTQYYGEIPDVSVDKPSARQLWGDSSVDKEQFHEPNAGVYITDPNFLLNRGRWNKTDIEETSTQVRPFFSNSIFSRGYARCEDYRYYALYEMFEKFTRVFQREDRFETLEQVHEEFQSNFAPVVLAQGERSLAAIVRTGGDEPEELYPYAIDEGVNFKYLNDLKVNDALMTTEVRDSYSNCGVVDFETLLEVNPEVSFVRGQEAKTHEEFQNTVISFMENHEVAGKLTAAQNGDVYYVGAFYQGSTTNLIATDRPARTLYDADGRLFDARCAADIANGNL